MEVVPVQGSFLLPVGAEVLKVDYILWQNRAWLAPLYIEHDGSIRPLRVIAPRWAPGSDPSPNPKLLEIFQQVHLTKAVLEQGHIPPDLAPLLEIVENPNVLIRR